MPVEVYYYENSHTLRGTKFIKNGTKLQEKLGQIVYNKFRPANCTQGYEVPIWIPFHIRSASKFKNDRQVPAGGALTVWVRVMRFCVIIIYCALN